MRLARIITIVELRKRAPRRTTLVLGTTCFGLVAGVHALLATGAGSMPWLAGLLVFSPAPVVFVWQRLADGRDRWWRRRPWVPAYLSLASVLSVMVLGGVGWIASERAIHPTYCQVGEQSLADYPELNRVAEPAVFSVPELGQRVGWFIPGPNGSNGATVMLLHGYGCRRQQMLDYAEVLHLSGYSTFLFDFHGRGESDGDAVTLGYYEQQDAVEALKYLRSGGDVDMSRLGVLGVSMGASVAILAAAREPEIKAVIADSAFASAELAVEEGFTRVVGLPAFLFAPMTLQLIKWRVGFAPEDIVPKDHIASISPRPVLLIHGLADSKVSPGNSQTLYDAAQEPKELWLIPGGSHTCGLRENPEEYSRRIVAFFDRHLE